MIFKARTVPTACKALWHSFLYLIHGKPVLAPAPIVRARRFDCFLCPHREQDQCILCTCYISVKTSLSAEACPDDRWPSLY